MDIISWLLARKYCDNSIKGISGVLSGKNCTIDSATKSGNLTTVIFKWTADDGTTRTTQIEVKDGETPAFSSVAITGGNRLTFTTQDPAQSVSFNVMDGAKGDTGISVVSSNVDDNNNLTLTLSNGNVINAGKIKAVTTVDNALSTTSSNPVENKVITNALNNKVDKEMGKGLFSDEEKAKLNNIEDGAQVNVLEKLIINGQEATITDKSIALTLITSAVSNLQNYYLKSETYTKQEVEDLIGSTVGVTIEIVEQLPTEGQSNVIYFLPTETEGVYSQYIYTTDGWILIGSTTVDLSNYYTKAQVDALLNGKQNVLTIDSFPTPLSNNPVASGGVYTAIAQMQPQFQFANMPTASASNLGFVYQYTGTTGTYTQNMFYRCIYDDVLGEYRWEEVIFHATVTVDSAISGTSTNPVQNKVIKEALDTKQDIMQYSTMPSAQDNLGKIVQYIGTNTANYTNGYFYKAIYDSASDVYIWSVIKFSADMLVDNALSTTSENPVQNKVITGAINNIQGVIPSEASSTNQLVDRDSLGTASQKDFTPYVSPDNTDIPISSSVYSAITNAVYGAYHPSGSKTIAELTSDLLVLANIGNVYKITEDGVTTNLFVGGAGQTIHTGDNAVVVYGGQPNTFLFDLQSGSIDLTPYQTKALESAVEGQTTVEGALGALSTNKATQAEVNDIVNVLGAKNLILYPCNHGSCTNNGITFTDNGDGTVTANGTATANASYNISQRFGVSGGSFSLKNGNYLLSGCESGSNTTFFIQAGVTKDNVYSLLNKNFDGDTEITVDGDDNSNDSANIAVQIVVRSGQTLTNKVFKPMIRLASIQDDTYVPYVPTNKELMSCKLNGYVGAKNLLPYPYYHTTKTENGLTITDNGDGTVAIAGTATSETTFYLNHTNIGAILGKGSYVLSGCPTGGNRASGYFIEISGKATSTDSWTVLATDIGEGATFTVTEAMLNWVAMHLFIRVRSGKAISSAITFKPMLRHIEDTDSTYQPYAKTNQQLTEDSVSWDGLSEVGAVNLLADNFFTRTVSGITFQVNNDGTVTASGTATANCNTISVFTLKKGTYRLSGCPSDGSDSTYRLTINNYTTSTNLAMDKGNGAIFTISEDIEAIVYCDVRSGFSGTVTFKPMLTILSYNGDYVPYAKTNRELTDVIPSNASILNKLVTESGFKSYGIKTIWTGSKTKGDTGMNFDASPYDLCFAQIGGTLCRLISGMGTGTSGRKKFTAVYAGRDYAGAVTYEQYYILDIVPDGTIATCGWFDIASKDNQNAKLAGQKALELALAGTSTWTNPTWKTLADVETNVNVTKIFGIKFQTKS